MRLIIVSNRAPVRISKEDGKYHYEASSGGLASGLRAYVEDQRKRAASPEILWIGWPGETVPKEDEPEVERHLLEEFGVKSVFLSADVMDRFYHGFCNKTIWPLFHYFPSYTSYDKATWDEYTAVNELFATIVSSVAQPDDVIWVHDYHLMLLPAMLRERMPDAKIGFFLHIPFPSYEVLRLLPSRWRRRILEGLLGADLVGFHTSDYRTYFLRSVERILGVEGRGLDIQYRNRRVRVGAFPMGIDYEKYHRGIARAAAKEEALALRVHTKSTKLVLSIDRQDYSKGIIKRLEGYRHFLITHPEWRQYVTVILVVVPSRDRVEHYQAIKSRIDEIVGRINGRFGTLDWTPIIYQYRSLSFDELIALYNTSDVALVTPLRDGMNLIAKEYVAARTDDTGVLILSEMAGAVDELDEAIIINPNIKEEISDAIEQALTMPSEEQARRIHSMQKRVSTYHVVRWADDFLKNLEAIKAEQRKLRARLLHHQARQRIVEEFRKAPSRLLLLDYDGTLTPLVKDPRQAVPSETLLETLQALAKKKNTRVVVLSGRDRTTLETWFKGVPIDLSAEHGLFLRKNAHGWKAIRSVRKDWKQRISAILEPFVEALQGSFIEEKEYSLVFHYRKSDPEVAAVIVAELDAKLQDVTKEFDLHVMRGSKVIEIKNAGIDKGSAALDWLAAGEAQPRFVLSVGDDTTDEDLFRVMPEDAFSIKVGYHPSAAMFNLDDPSEVLGLLRELATSNESQEVEMPKETVPD